MNKKRAIRFAPKVGDIVECRFDDHVEDAGDVLDFIVWGRVEQVTRTKLVILSWAYADGTSRNDCNEKRWCIVRKAVQGGRVLR
jgi:uncharacterized protein YifN (PemK superfamily)